MPIRNTDINDDIARCFGVMAELRTRLKEAEFVDLVRGRQMDGYRLAFVEEEGAVVAVAGYRIFTNLFIGKNLYVDDLVTSNKVRSKGHSMDIASFHFSEKLDTI